MKLVNQVTKKSIHLDEKSKNTEGSCMEKDKETKKSKVNIQEKNTKHQKDDETGKKPVELSTNLESIARHIHQTMRGTVPLPDILSVLKHEKEAQLFYLKMGYKIVIKNHMTLEPVKRVGKKWKSPLDGKIYDIPGRVEINVRIGDGFKNQLNPDSDLALSSKIS